MIKLEHASLVVLTGNGLAVGEDLARRFIFCQLDPRLEDPEARPFEPGFLDEIERRRADLLTAALTIWRWGRQNRPKAGIPLGSFETWGQWVRDPLLALGCQDPVSQIKEIKARDPKRQKVAEIYELWWENHAGAPTRASEIAEEVRAAVDPQGRGRQYVAKAIEDLTGTRQSGFVLTRQKGEGRKAVATYALTKTAPPGDSAQRHPPHTPHPPGGTKTSAKSTAPENGAGGDAQGMPRGMPDADSGHTQGISDSGDSENGAISTVSDEPQGMGGMGGMPPATDGIEHLLAQAPDPVDRRGCDFCGKPADHQPLRQVGDGSRSAWLHRRCEVPWLNGQPGPERTTVYQNSTANCRVTIQAIKTIN